MTDKEKLALALKMALAMQKARMTAIVADDFPKLIHEADVLMEQFLKEMDQ